MLRPFESTDASVVEALAGDADVARTTNLPHPYPPGGAREFIAAGHAAAAQGLRYPFAIVCRLDGLLLGCMALRLAPAHRRGELAYWIGRATTGIADDNVRHLATMSLLADRAGRVRMIGTAAGDYAYVASGWADGLLMYSSYPWDNEAGALLVTEAGGRVERRIDAAGKAFYIAGNREIQRRLDDLVAM